MEALPCCKMIFVRKLQDLMIMTLPPTEQVANAYRGYMQLLQKEVKVMTGMAMDYKATRGQDRVLQQCIVMKINTKR